MYLYKDMTAPLPYIFVSPQTPLAPRACSMARPQLYFTGLSLLVLCTLLPTAVLGNKKAAIFNKIADNTRDLQAAPATTGASAFFEKVGRFSLEGFMDTFEDMTVKQWGTPKTTLDMDLMGLMRDVFVQDEDHTRLLQEAWADPEILRTLMEDLPMFDVIKPLRALKEKKTLTAKDVSKLVNLKIKTKMQMGTYMERQIRSITYPHITIYTYTRRRESTPCSSSKMPWAKSLPPWRAFVTLNGSRRRCISMPPARTPIGNLYWRESRKGTPLLTWRRSSSF